MANRIKGITVEIGGDTTKLQTALKGVNSQIKSTQAQLKDVNKLLKMDPGNTELLAQKHKLLKDAVQATKEKLETLKTAAEQANQALANGEISKEQYDALQREIIETEKDLEKLEAQANESSTALQSIAAKGEKLKSMGDQVTEVGKKFLPVTGAVVGLGTVAVKTAADFDSAMSKVAAVSGATGKDFDALKAKAREMGSKTKFSASEAAEAMNYMAMAGWKTEDMLDGLDGVMDLAAASGEDLATTSDIVTDSLTAFGLSAKDSGHFADVLAAASSNANTNVKTMGETFKYCAPVAGALGFSVEDTAVAIGLMANAGIKGSQAGTSLRTIMNNLSGDVKICGSSIGQVTIATTNADGSMRSLSDILADCRKAFSGLSDSEKAAAAESLVGKNAMSGFLALMNAGQGDVDKLTKAIGGCDGSAKKMASTMQDNLEGQMTTLKSQLQELAISFGQTLMPAIRTIVGWIQGFVDKLNSMDEGTRKIIVTIALVAAAIGPVLIVIGKVMSAVGTIMTIIPKLVSFIGLVSKGVMALNAALLANPIVLIVAAIAALVVAFIYLWNNCEEFRQFWIDLWDKIKTAAIAVWEGLKEFFKTAWEAIKSTAQTIWNGIKNFFSSLWNGIKNIFQTVVDAIKLIITTYFNIYKTVITTVLNAIKTVITTVWNAIKTAITTVVNAIKTVVTTAWNAIKTAITTVLNAIKTVVTTIWNAIKSAISTAVNSIKTVVTTVWNGIKNTVTSVGSAIKNAATTVWNNVTSAVKTAMSNVFGAVKSGFSNVKDHITGLASSAFNWGKDLIMGIVNGIKSCISKVADAAKSVADKIKSFLHFSVPDEGPLTDYEKWMPDFMKGLAKGIEDSKSMVTKAMESVSSDMVISPKMNQMQMAMAGTGSYTSADMSGIVSAIKDAVSNNQSSQSGDIVIPVYLGGTLLDEVIVNAHQRANLRSGGR